MKKVTTAAVKTTKFLSATSSPSFGSNPASATYSAEATRTDWLSSPHH